MDLAVRIKEFYEYAYRTFLPRRMPVILRVDGKAFHSYTRGMNRPFDERLEEVMNLVAIKLCKEIQGAQIAYVQSDEISILIHGYKKLNSESWFGNNVQKMTSVSAGIASAWFTYHSSRLTTVSEDIGNTQQFIESKLKPAVFDSRVFVLPESEVCNYFIWRQQDATRNSISMLAQSLYSHKELNGVTCNQMQELCFQKGHNWNDLPIIRKRGRCIRKFIRYTPVAGRPEGNTVARSYWDVDYETPIFTENRNYIEDLLKTYE
jgi:tRNA(His) guanylyltransferase